MPYLYSGSGYVKFVRGSSLAWERLQNPDNDTLYFISDPDSATGKLYLGSKLICGEEVKINLQDIENVLIEDEEDILNNSILIYDKSQKKWIPKSLNELISTSPSGGSGKLEKLIIGPHEYDGTKEIKIETYDGEKTFSPLRL